MNDTVKCKVCGNVAEYANATFISKGVRYDIYYCKEGHDVLVEEQTGKVVSTAKTIRKNQR